MDLASVVDARLGIGLAVFIRDLDIHHVDQNAGGCGAGGVVGPSALLCRALEARALLLPAEDAFQLQSSFGNLGDVGNNLPARLMIPFEVGLWGVNRA